jgi:hypothetical protein
MGDFNYVPSKRDRVNKHTGEFTGHNDENDEREFQRLIATPYQMHELEQEHFTHDNAQVRSRIDRIYMNHHLSDQLDRSYSCAALAWIKKLSAHRPVSFSRRKKGRHEAVAPPIPSASMDDPEWPARVALKYGELRRVDSVRDQPLRRLLLAKQAIREVSLTMGRERRHNVAQTEEDKLGWTLTFLRAAEDIRLFMMERCALAYPHLSTLVDFRNPNLRAGGGLEAVRNHAVQLARSSITNELKALDSSDLDELQRANYKEHLLVRLKRLLPGASTGLNAMADDVGDITTDPRGMADILRNHWAKVFTQGDINRQLLNEWLNVELPRRVDGLGAAGLPGTSFQGWQIQREDVEHAVQKSGNSMPGPDRIPYKAWRALGDFGVDLLFDAMQTLAMDDADQFLDEAYDSDGGQRSHDFNLGLLCCLPKKKTGVDDELGDYYSGNATRPLSLVNTDNRLLANAARNRWEPIFNLWVSDMQQGFLKGRSMLSNVIDVDYESMKVSLKHRHGALLLFDIQAAFPSVSHEFIMAVLEWVGMPKGAINFIRSLYSQNKCVIACKGALFNGFNLTAGIRQGCPLSPLLFVITLDLLLRRLQKVAPCALTRAFADDTAMVIDDLFDLAGPIHKVFQDFGTISRMVLNIPKTVIIPLWHQPLAGIKGKIAQELPDWRDVEVNTAGRYLGFMSGPGKGTLSWTKANLKYEERVGLWSSQGLGLQYSAMSYNIFAVSVLSYLAQLENPPAETYQLESAAMVKVAVGPGNWSSAEDLWHLRECYTGRHAPFDPFVRRPGQRR